MGYFNVSVDNPDDDDWDDHLVTRLCIQFSEEGSDEREQIRWVNRNPIADEDHNHLGSDYETQFSRTGPTDPWVENYNNITFFCSRRHDWEGLINTGSPA